MQKKEWRRSVLIGCIVAAIFFGWWLRGFLFNWRFQLFSLKSWRYIVNEFESGWQPSSVSDWIFLLTLFLAVPVFLHLWYLCDKIKWRKLLKTIWKSCIWVLKRAKRILTKLLKKIFGKKKSSKKTALAPPVPPALTQSKSNFSDRPKPVAHSAGVANLFQSAAPVAEQRPTFNAKAAAPVVGTNAAAEVPAANPWAVNDPLMSFKDQPLDEIQLPQREPVIEDVPGLFTNAGYHLIPNVSAGRLKLDYVAICADKIYAVLVDREAGDWLAEEEPFNGEAPLWFSEIDHRVSPIYELKQCAEEMQKKVAGVLPDLPVIPFMIEEKGNIINAEEMMKTWKELNVVVARTDVGGMEDLPITANVISAVTPASMTDIETLTKLIAGDEK